MIGLSTGHAPPGGAANARNGATAKRVQTELGTVELKTPRDGTDSFEPQLVRKRQTRLAGLDDRVLGRSRSRCPSCRAAHASTTCSSSSTRDTPPA